MLFEPHPLHQGGETLPPLIKGGMGCQGSFAPPEPCFAPVQLSFAPVQEAFGAPGPKDLVHPLLITFGNHPFSGPLPGPLGRKPNVMLPGRQRSELTLQCAMQKYWDVRFLNPPMIHRGYPHFSATNQVKPLVAQTLHQGCRATAVALHLCSICGLVFSQCRTIVALHP